MCEISGYTNNEQWFTVKCAKSWDTPITNIDLWLCVHTSHHITAEARAVQSHFETHGVVSTDTSTSASASASTTPPRSRSTKELFNWWTWTFSWCFVCYEPNLYIFSQFPVNINTLKCHCYFYLLLGWSWDVREPRREFLRVRLYNISVYYILFWLFRMTYLKLHMFRVIQIFRVAKVHTF